MSRTATSQLQSPVFNPEPRLLQFSISVHVLTEFFRFLQTPKNIQLDRLATLNCPLDVRLCVDGAGVTSRVSLGCLGCP